MTNELRKISRRRFLTLTGGTVGATALACCGLIVLGTQQLAVEFIESSCGKKKDMRDTLLVAYASRAGSTGEVAGIVGQALCEAGAAVNVRLAKEVGLWQVVLPLPADSEGDKVAGGRFPRLGAHPRLGGQCAYPFSVNHLVT